MLSAPQRWNWSPDGVAPQYQGLARKMFFGFFGFESPGAGRIQNVVAPNETMFRQSNAQLSGNRARADSGDEGWFLNRTPNHTRVSYPISFFIAFRSLGDPDPFADIFGQTNTRPNSNPFGIPLIQGNGSSIPNGRQFRTLITNGNTRIDWVLSSNRLAAGVLDIHVVVCKSTDSRWYRNGQLVSTRANTLSGPNYGSTGGIIIGNAADTANNRNANIDVEACAMFDGELSLEEINSIFADHYGLGREYDDFELGAPPPVTGPFGPLHDRQGSLQSLTGGVLAA